MSRPGVVAKDKGEYELISSEESSERKSYIDQLPDDVFSAILKYLTIQEIFPTRLVSTRWNKVIVKKIMQSREYLTYFNDNANRHLLEFIENTISKLHISYADQQDIRDYFITVPRSQLITQFKTFHDFLLNKKRFPTDNLSAVAEILANQFVNDQLILLERGSSLTLVRKLEGTEERYESALENLTKIITSLEVLEEIKNGTYLLFDRKLIQSLDETAGLNRLRTDTQQRCDSRMTLGTGIAGTSAAFICFLFVTLNAIDVLDLTGGGKSVGVRNMLIGFGTAFLLCGVGLLVLYFKNDHNNIKTPIADRYGSIANLALSNTQNSEVDDLDPLREDEAADVNNNNNVTTSMLYQQKHF